MYDILIKNGRILDGSANPGFKADIGVHNGKIQTIGSFSQTEASKTIDAKGKIVTPGFIDTHSHSDLMLFVEPMAKQKIMQGINNLREL